MLERLSEVRWGELNAAYSPADWMPEVLWKLLDPDAGVRSEALDRLDAGIHHQQSADEATPHVVPFLIELAACPSVPDRSRLLLFLATLIDMDDGPDTAANRLACVAAAWSGAAVIARLMEDPISNVRITSGYVMASLATRWHAIGPADAAPRLAHRLRERLASEVEPLARAGHAFALGTIASRMPEARAWLRAVEEPSDLGDPAGLACALRLIDLEVPLVGLSVGRFAERLFRFDPVALGPEALVQLPWWSGPDIGGEMVVLGDVEDHLEERFERSSKDHPEIVELVEQRASMGRGIERANALRLANPRSGDRQREWPAIKPDADEDLTGALALATVALRGDALEVFRWAVPYVVEAFRRPDLALRLRASWFLCWYAETGLAPRVSEFADAIRGERESAVLVNLARALRPSYGDAARLSLKLLQGWLEAEDGPNDREARRKLWRTIAALARYAPVEELAAWLLGRIDGPAHSTTHETDSAEATAILCELRMPEGS